MKSARLLDLRLRSILIVTHLCVCSLSVGVTLAILNVHPGVVFLCLFTPILCAAYILKKLNKQYAFRKLGTLYFTHKNGKLSIEYLKLIAIDPQDSTKEQDQVKW